MNDKTIVFLATAGPVGSIPKVPGTIGTMVGLPFCFLLSLLNQHVAFLIIIGFIIFSVWISEKAEIIIGRKDPGSIVIDEIAGIFVTFIGVSISWKSLILGFFIFRFFDILKLPPIKQIEHAFPGGTGIVFDDIVAGIMGNIVLYIIIMMI